MNINGKVRITNIKEISKKLSVGTIYISTQMEEEKWSTSFIKCKVVGKALENLKKERIRDKDKIEVEGFLTSKTFQDRKGIEITDLEAVITNLKLAE